VPTTTTNTPSHSHFAAGVRSIAAFEAFKGLVVLLAGFGLLHYIHRDLQALAEELVHHTHLNPARHYPRIFIEAAGRTSDARLRTLAALAFVYSGVRFIEAYGLWRLRAWAEWFAIVSGGIYVPLELYEIFRRPSWLRLVILLLNLVVVAYLARVRWAATKRSQRGSSPAA
jgi:uncharacterized membrane protein (DUF2068 family)